MLCLFSVTQSKKSNTTVWSYSVYEANAFCVVAHNSEKSGDKVRNEIKNEYTVLYITLVLICTIRVYNYLMIVR